MPEVEGVDHLASILFRVGPVRKEEPITEQDLESWERRRGIELAPWQADLLVDASRAYLSEMHAARKISAAPPWPPAIKMWKYVTDHINAPKKEPQDGRSQ